MGKARKDEKPAGDWRHATLSVALVVAIVGTLALGAVLEAGPDRARTRESGATRPAAPLPSRGSSAASTVAPDPVAPVAPAADSEGPALAFSGEAELVDRAIADERRLGASGRGYTLQFGVMCDPENVRSTLEALSDEPSFYLLTMLYRDRACFRLCWGFYDTERQAAAERAIPETLGRITATPKVISVADALP